MFTSLGLDRRDALWAVKGLRGTDGAETLPLFAAASERDPRSEPDADLPPMPPGEEVIHDYRHLGLSLKAHPVSFVRAGLEARRTLSCAELGADRAWARRRGGRAGAGAPAPGHGERGGVHDPRGRDRHRQYHRLAQDLRGLAAGRARRPLRRRQGPGAARRRGHPSHRAADDRPDRGDHRPERWRRHRQCGAGAGRRGPGPQQNPWIAKDAATAERARRAAEAALPSGRNFH